MKENPHKKTPLRYEQFCSISGLMLPEARCHDLQTRLFFNPMTAVAQLLVFLCDLSPSLKPKLSCQRAVDLTCQFSSGQKSSSIKLDLLLNMCGQEPKNVILWKLIVRFCLSSQQISPPQDHLMSKLSSPRQMKSHFPRQELLLWKMRCTYSCLREALKVYTISNPGITEVCDKLLILQRRPQPRQSQKTDCLKFHFSHPHPVSGLVTFFPRVSEEEKKKPESKPSL